MRDSPSELSNEELRDQYKAYHDRVESLEGGVSTGDLRYLNRLEKEIRDRGGRIIPRVEIKIPEEEEREREGELTEGLEDNPYEKAFPEDEDKLLDDIRETLDSGMSRPAKADEVLGHAQVFVDYAKNTEQVADE